MSAKNKPMANLTFNQAMAVARAVAVEAMPYFRSGILDLVPREAPGLGTMALTGGSILMVDPAVLKAWTPNQAGAVVLHEWMHKFGKHAERFHKLLLAGTLTRSEEDQALWNRMCDAEINDDLLAAGLELPSFTHPDGTVSQPCTPESIGGYPENRLAEEYLKNELAKRRKRPPKGGGGGKGQQGNQPQPDPNGMFGGAGSGHCGSCAHNPVPHEPSQDDPDARSEIDQEATRKQVMEDVKAAASRGKGNVPHGIRRLIDEENKPAKVPWSQKLSRSARSAVATKNGMVDYTMEQLDRRQGAYFGMKDEPRLPGMHAPMAEVAIVADTSGSMGEPQMRKILNEAAGVIKNMAGAKITFIACDAKVHSMIRSRSVDEMRLNMNGGGGTDFRPAFEALKKAKPRPNVVIFATDGYGDYPDEPPSGMNVIWLNIGGHIAVPWGETINLDAEDLEDSNV